MKVVVIGCGSIGRRHIKNLCDVLNKNDIYVYDVFDKSRDAVVKELGVQPCIDLDKELESAKCVLCVFSYKCAS